MKSINDRVSRFSVYHLIQCLESSPYAKSIIFMICKCSQYLIQSSIVWWWVSPPVTRETGVQFPVGENFYYFLEDIPDVLEVLSLINYNKCSVEVSGYDIIHTLNRLFPIIELKIFLKSIWNKYESSKCFRART